PRPGTSKPACRLRSGGSISTTAANGSIGIDLRAPPTPPPTDPHHPLATRPQRRQRPRRAEERDVATSPVGLRAPRTRARGRPNQHPVQRSLGSTPELFPALDETAGQMARGPS